MVAQRSTSVRLLRLLQPCLFLVGEGPVCELVRLTPLLEFAKLALRLCEGACVRARVRACVRARVRPCVRA